MYTVLHMYWSAWIIHNVTGKVPSENTRNGVLQILGCNAILDTVRNSRQSEAPCNSKVFEILTCMK